MGAVDNPGVPGYPPHQYTRVFYPEFVSHELFHAWNGGVVQYEPVRDGRIFQLETWINEGATVYYSAWVRGVVLGLPAYREAMGVRWRQYERSVGTPLDLAVEELTLRIGTPTTIPPPQSELTTMLYARSSLLAYLLDLGLFGAGVSMDGLMRYLYDHYGLVGRRWRQADLPSILRVLSGQGFEAFFDAYLFTNARLPLDGTFVYVDRERNELR